ncbi:hypothetical protein MRX96_012510 [Rhipicephalus microplus]
MAICVSREEHQRQRLNQPNNSKGAPSAYTDVIEDAGVATDVSGDDGLNMVSAVALPGVVVCFNSTLVPPPSARVPVLPCPPGTDQRFVIGCWTVDSAKLELSAATYDCDDATRKTNGARFEQLTAEPVHGGPEHRGATGEPNADAHHDNVCGSDGSSLHERNAGSYSSTRHDPTAVEQGPWGVTRWPHKVP